MLLIVHHFRPFFFFFLANKHEGLYDIVLSQSLPVENLRVVTDCVCPGDMVTYECTVCGGESALTVWSGSGFRDCGSGEIILSHPNSPGTKSGICNNGEITGHVLSAENGCYTSKLNVTFNDQLQNSTVICSADDGRHSNEIGRLMLSRNTGIFLITLFIRYLLIYSKIYN